MANLKVDVLNKVGNEKYFQELELVRLAQDPNMKYKDKVEEISAVLIELAILDAQASLVEKYFQEPSGQAPVQGEAVPQGRVVNGQSHGE